MYAIRRTNFTTIHEISASVIQGSSIGPATYAVNAADLKPFTPGNEMDKFADDSYIIIPAVNSSSRLAEIKHAETWAYENNLKVNPAKYMEIIFVDKRRKVNAQPPPPLPGIERVTSVKILGVTITNSLSVAEHVHATISSCAQTLYALRVLRSHGMNDSALQTVFRSVVIAKLQYASSAWRGFSTAAERHRIDAFIRRCARCRFVPPDLPSFETLCRTADEELFKNITTNNQHVLHRFLPLPSHASQNYNLRPRSHNFELPSRISHLTDCNFLTRMLYANIY